MIENLSQKLISVLNKLKSIISFSILNRTSHEVENMKKSIEKPIEKKTIPEADGNVQKFRNDAKTFMEENLPYIIGSVAAGVAGVVMIGFGLYWALLEN